MFSPLLLHHGMGTHTHVDRITDPTKIEKRLSGVLRSTKMAAKGNSTGFHFLVCSYIPMEVSVTSQGGGKFLGSVCDTLHRCLRRTIKRTLK